MLVLICSYCFLDNNINNTVLSLYIFSCDSSSIPDNVRMSVCLSVTYSFEVDIKRQRDQVLVFELVGWFRMIVGWLHIEHINILLSQGYWNIL